METILIIDDEENLRETICEMLTFVGYEVHQAENGLVGLDKIKQVMPDLILCDIMMPVLDGYGFMKQHQHSKYSNIPVLFFSAKSEPKDIEEALTTGVKGYIKKPFLFTELKKQIEFYLLSENRL